MSIVLTTAIADLVQRKLLVTVDWSAALIGFGILLTVPIIAGAVVDMLEYYQTAAMLGESEELKPKELE